MLVAIIGLLLVAITFAVNYSEATILFGLIASISAQIVGRKISDKNWALGLIAMLAITASFPFKKLFSIDGFAGEMAVSMIYILALWIIAGGWRHNWR